MSLISGSMGAVMGSNAQNNATDAQSKSAADALAQQRDLYNQDVARNKPFYDNGVKANSSLDKMVNGNYDMNESPSARFQLAQGTKSLNSQLSARGLLGSGNAAQRMAELSSGIAASDYDKQYSRLLDQVKIGTGASAAAGASSNTLSQNIGNSAAQQQAAIGAAGANRAALYSGLGAQSGNAVGNGLNAYKLYQAYTAPEAGTTAATTGGSTGALTSSGAAGGWTAGGGSTALEVAAL
jgi:hypothetical protein